MSGGYATVVASMLVSKSTAQGMVYAGVLGVCPSLYSCDPLWAALPYGGNWTQSSAVAANHTLDAFCQGCTYAFRQAPFVAFTADMSFPTTIPSWPQLVLPVQMEHAKEQALQYCPAAWAVTVLFVVVAPLAALVGFKVLQCHQGCCDRKAYSRV